MATPQRREPPPAVPWMWLGLGAAAVAALVWAAVDAGAPQGAGGTMAARPAPVEAASVAVAESEARRLETRLARIEADLATLRDGGVSSQGDIDALAQRLDLVEEAFGPITGSVEPTADIPAPGPDPAPAPAAARRGDPPPEALPGPPGAERAPTALFDPGEDGRAPSAYDRVIAASRPRFAPSVAYGIDLGGFGNLGELKRYWAQLVGENPLLLGGLMPRQVTRVETDGMRSFRLIAGPLGDIAASERLCAALRERAINCSETVDSGETL